MNSEVIVDDDWNFYHAITKTFAGLENATSYYPESADRVILELKKSGVSCKSYSYRKALLAEQHESDIMEFFSLATELPGIIGAFTEPKNGMNTNIKVVCSNGFVVSISQDYGHTIGDKYSVAVFDEKADFVSAFFDHGERFDTMTALFIGIFTQRVASAVPYNPTMTDHDVIDNGLQMTNEEISKEQEERRKQNG